MKKVLICDDDPCISELLATSLGEAGYQTATVNSLNQLENVLSTQQWDALLLDLYLGAGDSLEAIPKIIRDHPKTKVIMISAVGSVEIAAQAVNLGATNFLSKAGGAPYLVRELDRLLRPGLTERQDANDVPHFGIIGEHPSILKLLEQINRIKHFNSTVLLEGESGTGKELVARAIHLASDRKKHPFRALNCGAIPKNLLEAELFGYKRGAFTDAKEDRKGFFEQCKDGTLLLDEIGEMPLELQVKLLRVLQEREVTPLGSTKSIPVDTRIIAATNRHLLRQVEQASFREDLYYRLSVITISLPPLRHRQSDIPLLVRTFIDLLNEKFQTKISYPTPELNTKLQAYPWPGNIRELQNAIERGIVLSQDQKLHLSDMLPYQTDPPPKMSQSDLGEHDPILPLTDAKNSFEKRYLIRLLSTTRGNIAEAARISGRYRADIYRMMNRHELNLENFRSH